jgi:putative PIN family toxin of toxin-antitoxin system
MKRFRVVLDTNVIISAVLFGGMPHKVLELAIRGEMELFLSIPILDEVRDVLMRPKFGLSAEQATRIIDELYAISEVINPAVSIKVVNDDPDDNMVLECALEAHAEYIVTGDLHLLELGNYEGIKINTPSAFIEKVLSAVKE